MSTPIYRAINNFLAGGKGEAYILYHKKVHSNGSGEFACVRGLKEGCPNLIGCQNLHHQKEGSYCLTDGQSVGGLLAVENKHRILVENRAPGAFSSVKQAVDSISI